jgi:hypothetical protein
MVIFGNENDYTTDFYASWDYLNLSLVNEYVGNITISTQVIKYN